MPGHPVHPESARAAPRASHLLRYALLLLVLSLGVSGAAIWWVFLRTLPQLEGALHLPELAAEVTVDRDAWGVPRIRAQSLDDLLIAQGYVVAQDRLWQMDLLRRAAAGELSEIFGAATLGVDRRNRTLGLRHVAQQTVESLPAAERALLEAYARGVNRFIEDHAGRLPWEFIVLRYRPRPWEPADTLLVSGYMYQVLTSTWEWELDRAAVIARVGPERARDLFVVESEMDHFVVGARAHEEEDDESSGGPLAKASRGLSPGPALPRRIQQALDALLSPLHSPAAAGQGDFAALHPGSNNWVVSGEHTASGKPLLANDTHLPLQVPSIYYTVHLTAPGYNARGFTLPGAPLVILGHNERIAWGFTNHGADVQDLYVVSFNPANPDEYRYNNRWERAERRWETIRVRGGDDLALEVVLTRHGPVVRREEGRAYALRWTALEPEGLRSAYWLLGRAQNWEEFLGILRGSGGPAQNIVYADVDGNIGYALAARIPVRRQGDGSVPLPGDTGAYEWAGYIPFDALPRALNPPGGIIVTANARVTGPGYRWYLTDRYAGPHRTARIHELLGADQAGSPRRFRAEDFLRMQTDIVSLPHRFIAGHIAAAAAVRPPRDARARLLAAQLGGWDGAASASSVEMSFVEFTRRALLRRLLEPHLGANTRLYQWWRHITFTENVLRDRPAHWLPADFPDYDSLLSACADEAVAQLQRETGSPDPARWPWGPLQPLEALHPLGRSGMLRRVLSLTSPEQAGGAHTVKQTGRALGPAQRFVADLGDWDRSLMNHHSGQSGQVFSPHYRDQFPLWQQGRSLPSPFSDAAAERARRHRLVLSPRP